MKPRFWTCGCGQKNCSREMGTPSCAGCGKLAAFTISAPAGQAGFVFGGYPPGDDGRVEVDGDE